MIVSDSEARAGEEIQAKVGQVKYIFLENVPTNDYELYYCTLKCSEFCAALASADASAVFLIKLQGDMTLTTCSKV